MAQHFRVHPRNRYQSWSMLLLLSVASIFFSGCNAFEPIDTSISPRSPQDKLAQAELALEQGDFNLSGELFAALVEAGETDVRVRSGYAESLAGQAGFAVLPFLDAWQNGLGPYDQSGTLFAGISRITDRDKLKQAWRLLATTALPTRADSITRGMIGVVTAVTMLLDKYDTNLNHRLDQADAIDFSTNDTRVASWSTLYRDLISGPSTHGATLESAFLDLAEGFNGNGEDWTFISPVNQVRIAGTYLPCHRRTILAVGDLIERLQTANRYFAQDLAAFSTALRRLDGGEEP